MAPFLEQRVPGWCQTALRRTIDRIGKLPTCLVDLRRKVLKAASAFDREFTMTWIWL